MYKKGDAERPLLDIREVCEMVGLSRATIYRLVRLKCLPPPAKIGGSVRWRKADLDDYIRNLSKSTPTSTAISSDRRRIAKNSPSSNLVGGQMTNPSRPKPHNNNLIKDVEDIRRRKLRHYIDIECEGKQINLVKKIGINVGELSGLLNGKKPFGEKKARALEKALGIKPGWLDEDLVSPTASAPKKNPQERSIEHLPVQGLEHLLVQGYRAASPEGKLKMIELATSWLDK